MTQDDLLTLAQRLREYNHNPHHINPVSDAFHRLITDSADALSQLAAIQDGMGEAVEVVAWRIEHPVSQWKVYEQRQDWAYQQYGHIKYQVQDLMTVAQHQRITAAMAAEVERLSARTAHLVEFTQQMARQNGEPYFQKLAKAALKKWSGLWGT